MGVGVGVGSMATRFLAMENDVIRRREPLSETFGASHKIWVSCSQEIGSAHFFIHHFEPSFFLSWNLGTLHPHVLCKHLEDTTGRNRLLPGVVPGSIRRAFPSTWRPGCPSPISCEAECFRSPLPMAPLPQQNCQRQPFSCAPSYTVHILRAAWINGCFNTLLRCHFLIKSEDRIHVCPAGWTSLIWFGRGSRINIHAGRDSFNLVFSLGWGEVSF